MVRRWTSEEWRHPGLDTLYTAEMYSHTGKTRMSSEKQIMTAAHLPSCSVIITPQSFPLSLISSKQKYRSLSMKSAKQILLRLSKISYICKIRYVKCKDLCHKGLVTVTTNKSFKTSKRELQVIFVTFLEYQLFRNHTLAIPLAVRNINTDLKQKNTTAACF